MVNINNISLKHICVLPVSNRKRIIMSVTAYLGLGSNMGDRVSNIMDAVKRLGDLEGNTVKTVSSLYETEPVGYADQPDFINGVVEIETEYDPQTLLGAVHDVENSMGRVRNMKWGPRIIDIDILLFSDMKIKTDELEIPHPEILQRSFVMVPLLEIAGESILGVIGSSMDYSNIPDGRIIRKL